MTAAVTPISAATTQAVAVPAVTRRTPAVARPAQATIALLGTGTVGSAVLARLAGWEGTPFGERLCLRYAANSRFGFKPDSVADAIKRAAGKDAAATPANQDAPSLDAVSHSIGGDSLRIVIDATASEDVAARHAQWLTQGIHVVTACKLGQGASLARWEEIRAACAVAGTRYGDSATVGAGLPLLKAIRSLQAGRDRIHAIAGVLSGSLAWLFHQYDGERTFSSLVRQAREAGYTEPDPRDDLSGEDVRRKLLILARAAGVALERDDVAVASLVPAAWSTLAAAEIDTALSELDASLRARCADARGCGASLRYVARLENGHAHVGLESLPADHPLAGGAGTDNRVAIWSDRYREQPLVIQGPGAGADVTAAGLLDDVLQIVNELGAIPQRSLRV